MIKNDWFIAKQQTEIILKFVIDSTCDKDLLSSSVEVTYNFARSTCKDLLSSSVEMRYDIEGSTFN